MRVYDDFSIPQVKVQVQTRPGVRVNRCDYACCRSPQAAGRNMRRHQQVLLWLSISILGALTLSPASMGQAPRGSAQSGTPSDWTHHHVIFSKPATAEETRRVQQDPRYWQQIRRQSPIVPEVDTRRVLDTELRARPHPPSPIKNPSKIPGLDRDWAIDLGSGASIGAGNYPAKYSFDTSTANCTTDFVVYPTGLTGVPGPTTGQASIVAYSNLYSGCGAVVPSVYWAYDTAEGTIQNSPVFSVDGTQLAFVQADASGNGELVLLKWAALSSESIGSPDSLSAV